MNQVVDLDEALIAPESWLLHTKKGKSCDRIDLDSLLSAVSRVQDWLRAWPSTGLLPFVHPVIYGTDRMPPFLQDAYTSCATYFASTPTTKVPLWRIIDRHVSSLIQAEGPATGPCCVVFHLARVQALLTYQTLRLFSDSPEERLAADGLASLLYDWGRQMVSSAVESSSYVASFPSQQRDDEAAWQAWCLAESIRRTWVVCCVVQGTALVMRGEEAQCPGYLRFTAQMGLWDARSAYAWRVAQKVSGGVALVETMSGKVAMEEMARKGEFDDFGVWALGVMGEE